MSKSRYLKMFWVEFYSFKFCSILPRGLIIKKSLIPLQVVRKCALPLQAYHAFQEYELCIQFMKIRSNHCSIFRKSPKDG
ncbi:unnamed protein product [Larinioides sclopetarius]|uniref:Uncharacterized protein n=1 Tax=Larinioides sclopetarius TaxID=280406 RepID=A0AAV2AG53_9ARAC